MSYQLGKMGSIKASLEGCAIIKERILMEGKHYSSLLRARFISKICRRKAQTRYLQLNQRMCISMGVGHPSQAWYLSPMNKRVGHACQKCNLYFFNNIQSFILTRKLCLAKYPQIEATTNIIHKLKTFTLSKHEKRIIFLNFLNSKVNDTYLNLPKIDQLDNSKATKK